MDFRSLQPPSHLLQAWEVLTNSSTPSFVTEVNIYLFYFVSLLWKAKLLLCLYSTLCIMFSEDVDIHAVTQDGVMFHSAS